VALAIAMQPNSSDFSGQPVAARDRLSNHPRGPVSLVVGPPSSKARSRKEKTGPRFLVFFSVEADRRPAESKPQGRLISRLGGHVPPGIGQQVGEIHGQGVIGVGASGRRCVGAVGLASTFKPSKPGRNRGGSGRTCCAFL